MVSRLNLKGGFIRNLIRSASLVLDVLFLLIQTEHDPHSASFNSIILKQDETKLNRKLPPAFLASRIFDAECILNLHFLPNSKGKVRRFDCFEKHQTCCFAHFSSEMDINSCRSEKKRMKIPPPPKKVTPVH